MQLLCSFHSQVKVPLFVFLGETSAECGSYFLERGEVSALSVFPGTAQQAHWACFHWLMKRSSDLSLAVTFMSVGSEKKM